MSPHGRIFAAGKVVWKNKIKRIQPNKPNDPGKEGDREQKRLLHYLCFLERGYLIYRLCCHHAVMHTLLSFSLIIPAKLAGLFPSQMGMKHLCSAMLDLKKSSHPSVICYRLPRTCRQIAPYFAGCFCRSFCSVNSVDILNLLRQCDAKVVKRSRGYLI